jgi:hypothetical protein
MDAMYVYYILRGAQAAKPVELEGDIDEEHFPGVNLGDGPAIIDHLVKKINAGACPRPGSGAVLW